MMAGVEQSMGVADRAVRIAPGDDGGLRRILSIDVARGLGIILVYYGHVVEQVMYRGDAAAHEQYKFIYSFHMPLFFLVSGLVAKDLGQVTIGHFMRSRLASRILPLIVFNVLLGLISVAATPSFPPIPLQTAANYRHAIVMTATRLPVFDIPTWFLMCLVSVEIIHAAVCRFVRDSTGRMCVGIAAFYLIGFALNRMRDFLAAGENWWFWNEAITMYAFYLAGVLLHRVGALAWPISRRDAAAFAALALALVFGTYGLNHGPFRLHIEAVVILAAAHGQIILFPLTALAGSFAVLLLGRALASTRWLGVMGRNALALFCLDGLFYHHLNVPLATWFWHTLPHGSAALTLYCSLATLLSLAAALPLAMLANHFVPQLVGRPTVNGPLLPRLLGPPLPS